MNEQVKIILTKMDLTGGRRRPLDEIGPRWTAQVDGKFIKWKKMIEGDEILALREAILDLHSQFGNLAEIDVRAYVSLETGYKDIPVHLYIESYGRNLADMRQCIVNYREEQIKKINQDAKGKKDFPFLILDEE